MLVSESRYSLADHRSSGVDKLPNILSSDGRAGVITRAVVDPLPKLNARDFCGCCVFHKVVQRYAAVATKPCTSIREHSSDV